MKTDAGEPVLASKVAVLGLRLDAPNMAALRYGATVCAVPLPGDPHDPVVAQQLQEQVNSLPMKCTPVDIGGGEKKLTISVPAAWTKPPE